MSSEARRLRLGASKARQAQRRAEAQPEAGTEPESEAEAQHQAFDVAAEAIRGAEARRRRRRRFSAEAREAESAAEAIQEPDARREAGTEPGSEAEAQHQAFDAAPRRRRRRRLSAEAREAESAAEAIREPDARREAGTEPESEAEAQHQAFDAAPRRRRRGRLSAEARKAESAAEAMREADAQREAEADAQREADARLEARAQMAEASAQLQLLHRARMEKANRQTEAPQKVPIPVFPSQNHSGVANIGLSAYPDLMLPGGGYMLGGGYRSLAAFAGILPAHIPNPPPNLSQSLHEPRYDTRYNMAQPQYNYEHTYEGSPDNRYIQRTQPEGSYPDDSMQEGDHDWSVPRQKHANRMHDRSYGDRHDSQAHTSCSESDGEEPDEGEVDFFDLSALNHCGTDERAKLTNDGIELIINELTRNQVKEIFFKRTLRRVALPEVPPSMVEGGFFEEIFQWLSSKGVKRIEEIRIRDSTPDGHKYILPALMRGSKALFTGIKRFCWLNKNVGPEIMLVATTMEELWLEWDGDVPSRWARKLSQLRQLKNIYIVVTEDNPYAAAFCSQLRTRGLEAECVKDTSVFKPSIHEKGEPRVETTSKQEVQEGSADPWFKAMQDFTKKDPLELSRVKIKTLKPVRVAIIDSGIDMCNSTFQKKVVARKAFPSNDMHDFIDLEGHGTHVAGLVLKVAPHAELLIARVTDDHGKFSPAVVQEAIKWAIDNGADVINCSWGFRIQPDGIDPMKCIPENIVAFAAVDNTGLQSSVYPWPARSRHVIAIGASEQCGHPWKYSQLIRDDPVFLFPGCDISSEFPRYLETSSTTSGKMSMSGTSMSTAIASGLAARILDYIRVTDVPLPETYEIKNLVDQVFREMCSKNQCKFVNAWDIFVRRANWDGAMKHFLRSFVQL